MSIIIALSRLRQQDHLTFRETPSQKSKKGKKNMGREQKITHIYVSKACSYINPGWPGTCRVPEDNLELDPPILTSQVLGPQA